MEGRRPILKKYKQLFRMQISKNRYAVISKTPDGKISMAQQVRVEDEDGNDSYIFIKNAFIFQTLELFKKFQEGVQNITVEEESKINKEQIEIPYKNVKEG